MAGTKPIHSTYKAAGDNKYSLVVCPTCGATPDYRPDRRPAYVFYFTDELSAREYSISGLCQSCQDELFKPPLD